MASAAVASAAVACGNPLEESVCPLRLARPVTFPYELE